MDWFGLTPSPTPTPISTQELGEILQDVQRQHAEATAAAAAGRPWWQTLVFVGVGVGAGLLLRRARRAGPSRDELDEDAEADAAEGRLPG